MGQTQIDRRTALLAGGALAGTLGGVGSLAGWAQAGQVLGPVRVYPHGEPAAGLGSLDRKGIEAAFGLMGRVLEGGVFMVDFPRSDLRSSIHGLPVMADLALDSEALFKQMGSTTVMMGEAALLERELGPVLDGLAREGIMMSALHNHLLTAPTVLFVHFMGQGDGTRLAQGLRRALAPSGTPFGQQQPNADVSKLTIDVQRIEQILGRSGETSGSVFQVSVPRREQITLGGMAVPSSFGVDSRVFFQPLGAGQAAIQTELVLLAGEVNAVEQTLRRQGVEVAAVHNHHLDDAPRLFYMHAWARGDAVALARIVRAALNRTNSAVG